VFHFSLNILYTIPPIHSKSRAASDKSVRKSEKTAVNGLRTSHPFSAVIGVCRTLRHYVWANVCGGEWTLVPMLSSRVRRVNLWRRKCRPSQEIIAGLLEKLAGGNHRQISGYLPAWPSLFRAVGERILVRHYVREVCEFRISRAAEEYHICFRRPSRFAYFGRFCANAWYSRNQIVFIYRWCDQIRNGKNLDELVSLQLGKLFPFANDRESFIVNAHPSSFLRNKIRMPMIRP
jgi:hypothetical protein